MKNITVNLIKKLRNITGISILDCKYALVKSKGDINLAIDNLRKSGIVKAQNRSIYNTNEGAIFVCVKDNIGVLVELNCETDFVAKNIDFISFGNKIVNYIINNNFIKLTNLKETFKNKISLLISKFGENINIKRFKLLKGDYIDYYLHNNNKIGVLLLVDKFNSDPNKIKFIKNITMHIAASNPISIYSNDIPNKIIDKEIEIQKSLAIKISDNPKIIKQIVDGRIKKFINSLTLCKQKFIFDTSKNVEWFLKNYEINLKKFIRFEINNKS
ncbi:Elongation factor Ts [Buchnera aphidicola (Neophyllaphis podocarpi)]|uniref:translation elongation factor Ts n=1 Tax=Buchnera aphidicola TaxID=9 RepID=UPI0031B89D82